MPTLPIFKSPPRQAQAQNGSPPTRSSAESIPNDRSVTGTHPHLDRSAISPVEEHSRFYFDDEIVSFLVEDKVKIRVHKHFLARESSFFRGVFASGPRRPDNTYVVDGLKINEFEALLGFFYDGMFRLSPSTTPIRLWVDLLSISTQFDFPKVREHAIAAIDNCQTSASNALDAATMIYIADKHHVEKWLKPAYLTLCEREESLSKEEAVKIGVEKVVMIAQAREKLLKVKLEEAATANQELKDQVSAATTQSDTAASSSDTQPKSRPAWRTIHPRTSKTNLFEDHPAGAWKTAEPSWMNSSPPFTLPPPSSFQSVPASSNPPFQPTPTAVFQPEVPLVEEHSQEAEDSGPRPEELYRQLRYGASSKGFPSPENSGPSTPKA